MLLKVKKIELNTNFTALLNSCKGIKVLCEIESHLFSMLSIAKSMGTLVNNDITCAYIMI